jgi:aminopeptidase N
MLIRLLAALLLLSPAIHAAQKSLHMPIGDPARKDREAKIVLDAVTDTATGEFITPREMTARLSGKELIFLGESHTSMDFHRVQLRVVQELHRAGKKVLIGLEMFPYTEQKYLDDWSRGFLTEEGFLQLAQWYKNWGYHWNYYRDIFLFARDNRLPMYAVNTPREVVSAVRKKGFQNLTPEEAAHIPQKIDTSNPDHFALFKAFFEEESGMHGMMNDQMAKSMFDAQCTWDATMAYNSVKALEQHRDKDTVMVVLIGSGHVAYGLGLERQAAQWFEGKMASVIPIQVIDDKDRPVESIQSSYANFIWGLPQEKESLYPDTGISTGEIPGDTRRKVLNIAKDSPAEAAGIKQGDILVSMDGTGVNDREALNRKLSEKRWGDAIDYVLMRDGKEMNVKILLRRSTKKEK